MGWVYITSLSNSCEFFEVSKNSPKQKNWLETKTIEIFSFYFRKFINRICFRRSEPFQKSRLSTSIIFSLIFKFYFCIKASPGHEQIIKPNELTFLLIERIYSHDNNKKCFYKLLNENTVQMKWRRKKVYFTQILWQKKTIC